MSVFIPQSNYNEIEGRKKNSIRRGHSVFTKIRSEDSDRMIHSSSSHQMTESRWPMTASDSTSPKISTFTLTDSFFFWPPSTSPPTVSMTTSQIQQWIVPNQPFLLPTITKTEWLGLSLEVGQLEDRRDWLLSHSGRYRAGGQKNCGESEATRTAADVRPT